MLSVDAHHHHPNVHTPQWHYHGTSRQYYKVWQLLPDKLARAAEEHASTAFTHASLECCVCTNRAVATYQIGQIGALQSMLQQSSQQQQERVAVLQQEVHQLQQQLQSRDDNILAMHSQSQRRMQMFEDLQDDHHRAIMQHQQELVALRPLQAEVAELRSLRQEVAELRPLKQEVAALKAAVEGLLGRKL